MAALNSKIKEQAALGTKHLHNMKSSMQFAFNSSMMDAPEETKLLDPAKATDMLRLCCNSSATRFDIAKERI